MKKHKSTDNSTPYRQSEEWRIERQKNGAFHSFYTLHRVEEIHLCSISAVDNTRARALDFFYQPMVKALKGVSMERHTEDLSIVLDDICVCSADKRACTGHGNWILQTR